MRNEVEAPSQVIADPVGYLAAIEDAWQRRDGEAAAAGYSDDAVLIYGNGATRSGEELRAWPQKWFDYAKDLRIHKTFRAFTGNCLAGEWESAYTHPVTKKTVRERGAEIFFIRPGGKVYLHHMYEHTWVEGDPIRGWPAI
jgi:nuclear transport factor 2 (NTF2) superfamily protein